MWNDERKRGAIYEAWQSMQQPVKEVEEKELPALKGVLKIEFVVGRTCIKQHLPSAVGTGRKNRCSSLDKNEPTRLIRSHTGIESQEDTAALDSLARDWGWQKTESGWVCPFCAGTPATTI
jgi:hypothetical protein